MRKNYEEIDWPIAGITLGVGSVAFGFGRLLYGLNSLMSSPALMGMVFVSLYIILAATILSYVMVQGEYNENPFVPQGDFLSAVIVLVIGIIGILGIVAILQLLYGIGNSSQDLLSSRESSSWGFIYGLLRIIFISVIGSIMGCMMGVSYGRVEAMEILFITSIIKAVLGAFVMEVGTSLLGIPSGLAWFILWLLLSITFVHKQSKFGGKGGGRL